MNRYKTQDRPNPEWIARGEKSDYFAPVRKTFMGRDALGALLDGVKPRVALVPAYTCDEVTNEFRKRSVEVVLYDINPGFTIDPERIAELIQQHRVDLFYQIIYFGMASLNSGLNREVKKRFPAVYIIEDRAHYLSNAFDFDQCDAYLYSFRKLLPVPEGGGLITRQPIEVRYSGKLRANLLPFFMHLKKRALGYNDHFNRTALTQNRPAKTVMPLSRLSGKIVERYDYMGEIRFRRTCFQEWVSRLEDAHLKPLFTKLGEYDIPQGCPILVDDATAVQQYMQRNRYYLRRHWRLGEEIKEMAPHACAISAKIITLPVYRGISEEIQERIIQLLINYSFSSTTASDQL